MVRLRPLQALREVYEAPEDMKGRPVDAFLFLSTKRIEYIGEEKTLATARAYEVLEVDLGFEEHSGQTTIMVVDDDDQRSANFARMMTHVAGGGGLS